MTNGEDKHFFILICTGEGERYVFVFVFVYEGTHMYPPHAYIHIYIHTYLHAHIICVYVYVSHAYVPSISFRNIAEESPTPSLVASLNHC